MTDTEMVAHKTDGNPGSSPLMNEGLAHELLGKAQAEVELMGRMGVCPSLAASAPVIVAPRVTEVGRFRLVYREAGRSKPATVHAQLSRQQTRQHS